jgi:hypothetical protein
LSRSLPSIRPLGPTQDAPFDTALWAYSGCSLRYGPLGLLRMLPSIRPSGATQDAHSEFPPARMHTPWQPPVAGKVRAGYNAVR